MRPFVLYLGHLAALPVTLVGVLLAILGGTRCHRLDPGSGAVLLVAKPGGLWHWFFTKFRFVGWCGGAVIVFVSEAYADHPEIVRHEVRHLHQMMVFPFGLQPILYGLSSGVLALWCIATGRPIRDAYRLNPFEIDARRHAAIQR